MPEPGYYQFKLGFQCSPIILTNGIAANIPGGGTLPIISILESENFPGGLLSGGTQSDPNQFFAQFEPLPSATLIENQIGQYTFANQATAANAIIEQPLRVSMLMTCPATSRVPWPVKTAKIMALRAALQQHNISGGTYTVATPSFFYTDCVMLNMRDVTGGGISQRQAQWQFDFQKPLITLQEAQESQNAFMTKVSSGAKMTDPSWSNPANTVGFPPAGSSGSTVGANRQLPGSNVIGTGSASGSALALS
jgi:hypothetical protein